MLSDGSGWDARRVLVIPGLVDERHSVIDGEVVAVEASEDRLRGVRLQSGHFIARDAVVVGPWFQARHALLDDLDVTVAEHPLVIVCQVQADAIGLMAGSGVWVAGNVAPADMVR